MYSSTTSERQSTNTLPEIEIQLPSSKILALIDTGNEVTCICEDVWENTTLHTKTIPQLPVNSVQLREAMGQRSVRVTKQILFPIQIEDLQINLPSLVVKNLIRPLIIGSDWLSKK